MNKFLIASVFSFVLIPFCYGADLTVEEDGGGDYTTLDEACDNITATDTITIQGAWDNIDSRAVIVSVDCNITATGDARISTSKHVAGTPTHYRLHVSDGNHCITVNDTPTSIDGIEVKQASSTISAECIRITQTTTVKNSILWSSRAANAQDGILVITTDSNFTAENLIIYNLLRAGLFAFQIDGTINVNSCGFYNCGRDGEINSGGVNMSTDTGETLTFNIHNTWVLACSFSTNDDYHQSGALGTEVWNISNSIDSDNSIAARIDTGSGNLASRTIRDSTSGGDEVLVNDITGAAPFDFSLIDDDTNNDAQEMHADSEAHGLTIPDDDIDGTSRNSGGSPVQGSNYDCAAFEIIVAAAPTFIPRIEWMQ